MTDENNTPPLSRGEAKLSGLIEYLSSRLCLEGHLLRYVSNNQCAECSRIKIRLKPKRPKHPKKIARENGEKFYTSNKPCKWGHISKRYVNSTSCLECCSLKKEQNLRRAREWRKKNKSYCKEFRKIKRIKEQEAIPNAGKIRYAKNKERLRELAKINRKKHKARIIAANKKRRHSKALRVPSWANLKAIDNIYKDRERISIETGIEHHVDHIIPLQGKIVSGLHVENNLQIISAAENLSKKNKFS